MFSGQQGADLNRKFTHRFERRPEKQLENNLLNTQKPYLDQENFVYGGNKRFFSLSSSLIICLGALSEPGQQLGRPAGFRNTPFPMEKVNINTPCVQRGGGMEITKLEREGEVHRGRKALQHTACRCGKHRSGEGENPVLGSRTQHLFPCLRLAHQGEEEEKPPEEAPQGQGPPAEGDADKAPHFEQTAHCCHLPRRRPPLLHGDGQVSPSSTRVPL